MDISQTTLWWVLAGLAVVAELATGTFYLLMVALGLASGAVAAHLGWSGTAQITAAAVAGGGATALWHWQRAYQAPALPAHENRDVNLDLGEVVHADHWAADGTTRVSYRGSSWTARLQPGSSSTSGPHRVVAVEGNWLVVIPAAPLPEHSTEPN